MERFKTPAGRLSTIFYSTSNSRRSCPRDDRPILNEEKSPGQETDTSEVIPEVRTTAQGVMRSSKQHFAWRDICLDIQVGGQNRRLLSNISGKTVAN